MSAPGDRLKTRLTLISTAVLLAVLASAQAAVLLIGRKDATAQLEASAKGVAVSVAHTLSLDADGYREFIRTKDPGSPYYKKMHDVLEAIRDEAGGIRFIDTERRLDADTTEVLLDAEPVGSADYLRPGETNLNDPEKDRVFTAGAFASFDGAAHGAAHAHANRRGRLIEADAPIVAEDGEILGAVCVDIERKRIFHQFRRTVITLVAADLLFACLFAAAMLRFSDSVLRWLFMGGPAAAYARAARDEQPGEGVSRYINFRNGLALIVLEPDSLSRLGEAYGRPFADKVLSVVSDAIRGSIRPEDQFVRYGKKGFALIVAEPATGKAMDIAERMRADIENAALFNEDRNEYVKLTVSIGVAIGDSLSRSAEDLVGNAEKALAQAKAKGNAVSAFGRWRGGVPA
jgi:diguanylate cyclase (GGDEF)-like protein